MEERNIRIILQYDGTRYDGWQKQGNTDKTVQGKLEQILERMTGRPVEVHGSGRTDAGVHALRQTANFHIPLCPSGGPQRRENAEEALYCADPKSIMEYLNRYLPEDIAVLEAGEAAPRFHSRLNAVSKTYLYRIETAEKKEVFERKYIYGLGKKLDEAAMRKAAGYLTGTHDFKAFCSLKRMKKSTVRTIESIEIRSEGTRMELRFTGNGFLYNMVRILTGTLIEAGLHTRSTESVREALESGERSKAGFTAPPEGLFLAEVTY